MSFGQAVAEYRRRAAQQRLQVLSRLLQSAMQIMQITRAGSDGRSADAVRHWVAQRSFSPGDL
jgi:hypothetical protein